MIFHLQIGIVLKFMLFTVSLMFFSCQEESVQFSSTAKSHNNKKGHDTLTLGSISNLAQYELLNSKPILSYLADSLKNVGVDYVNIQVVSSIEEMLDLVKEDKIDFIADSPYPVSTILESSHTMEPFLKQYKAGVEYYHSVIFVRKDSEIESLYDLYGKIIGFEKEYSTSGFILPLYFLEKNYYELNYINTTDNQLSLDKINYTFTGDDENTIYWVIAKKIDAGVTDNVSFLQFAGENRSELKIIYKTEDVPRQIVLINKNLSDRIKSRIYTLLLNADKSDYGRTVLKSYFGTTKYDTLKKSDIISLNNFSQM